MQLYTVSEVAKIFKTNRQFVYKLIDDGELPVIRGLGRIKITEDALNEYIKGLEENDEAL